MFFTDKGYHIYWFEKVASKLLRIIITLDHNHPANGEHFPFQTCIVSYGFFLDSCDQDYKNMVTY